MIKRRYPQRNQCGFYRAFYSCVLMVGMALVGSSARAAEIVVPKDHPTIQAAVDAASPGDTIMVLPGLYKEQITIAKDLILKGAGAGNVYAITVIQAPRILRPFAKNTLNSRELAAIIRITDGARVRMSGFAVTGPIACGLAGRGIVVVKDATLEISASQVTLLRPRNPDCAPSKADGRSIAVGLPPFVRIKGESVGGSVGHATITRLVIDKYHFAGVTVAANPAGPPSTATISDNSITGGSEIPVDGQIGVQLAWAIATVKRNTIRENVCTGTHCGPDPINDFQSAGIGAPILASTLTEISENIISGADVGVYGGASGGAVYTIRENLISNNRLFGIAIQDGKGRTKGNTIDGVKIGIAVVAGTADAVGVLNGDHITNTSVAPIKEIQCCGFTARAIVK